MKRIHLWGLFGLVAVILAAVVVALQTGEQSPVFASGEVTLSSTLTEQARGVRTLFLIVRDADSPMPMPYGAMKVVLDEDASGKFYRFAITRERLQVMNQNTPPPQRLMIKARLDRDGSGGADMAGDLTGALPVPVRYGTEGADIEIVTAVGDGAPQ